MYQRDLFLDSSNYASLIMGLVYGFAVMSKSSVFSSEVYMYICRLQIHGVLWNIVFSYEVSIPTVLLGNQLACERRSP